MEKREVLSDLLVCGGVAAVAVGAGLIFLPAGLIVGGFGSIWIAWQLMHGGGAE